MKKVLLTHTTKEIGPVFSNEALKKLESFTEVIRNPYQRRMTQGEILANAQEADAVIIEWYSRLDAEFFEKAMHLKVVGLCAESSHNIDLDAATRNGVIVANVPERYMEPLVHLISCYMLCLATGIFEQQRILREREEIVRFPWFELKGKTLGLLGIGRLGQRIAQMALSYGMKVLAYDPYILNPEIPVQLVSLEDMMSKSRFVVICCNWTQETTDLIGELEIGWMKKEAYLINPGRGAIINETALARALSMGNIAGAAIDVFSEEHDTSGHLVTPPLVQNNPLFSAPNTIVTPHIGGHTVEAYLAESIGAVDALETVFKGGFPKNVANPDVFNVILNKPDQWAGFNAKNF